MEIHPVTAKSFHAGGRANWRPDMMKLIVVFRNFVNVPKNWIYEIHGHLVYYLHNCKFGYNIQWYKFPNLQWHNMTCSCYEKHHNMLLLTGLSVNIMCLPKWSPPTILTFHNNTCTQHVFMHNCKATPFRKWSSKKSVFYLRKYSKSNVYSL